MSDYAAKLWFSGEQQRRYEAAYEADGNARDVAIIRLALYAGMSYGELERATWESITECEGERLWIDICEYTRRRGRRKRTLPLSQRTAQALWRLYGPMSGPLFVNPDPSSPDTAVVGMTAQDLYQVARRHATAVLGCFDRDVLRNTFCRRLCEIGLRLEEVSRLSGLWPPQRVLPFYEIGIDEDVLVDAIDRLDGSGKPAPPKGSKGGRDVAR